MLYGLNGYHTSPILGELRQKGFNMLRIGAEPAIIDHVISNGFSPLVIARDADEVNAAGTHLAGVDVEFANEPDGSVDKHFEPAEYAALIPSFVEACHAAGATPWIGAISNLHHKSLAWFADMIQTSNESYVLPGDVGITVHRYPAGRSWDVPHPGFANRDAEIDAIRGIVGVRRIGCSEVGYHTAPQIVSKYLPRWYTWHWTDEQTAEQMWHEWRFWEAQDAAFCVQYQIIDGQTNTREDRFGISTVHEDGSFKAWKPIADSLQA